VIHQRTVLVTGAGASHPYGFPLGRNLRDLVCALAAAGEWGTARELLANIGFSTDAIRGFAHDLSRSAYGSVDTFLEDFDDYIPIGKAAIATVLIPFEEPRLLFPGPANHWYEVLVNALDTDPERFKDNQLSIVTFNYDRSIEHYLSEVLTIRRRRNQRRALDDFSSIEIVHVHGALGNYDPTGTSGRPYTTTLSEESIQMAARDIIVIGEAKDDGESFVRARQLLAGAARVEFLGFGFNEASVKRLGLFSQPWDHERRSKVRVGSTFLNVPGEQCSHIRENILRSAIEPGVPSLDMDIAGYLGKYPLT
jgi:hypothetical protein